MKSAIIFPGQGAQVVGMGKDLAEQLPEAKALFDQASDILGYDLSRICFEGPQEDLTRSDHAQPAIFVHSIAAWNALKSAGSIEPAFFAGLSSGEWAALHAAGVVSYEDSLRILEARGRFMQAACEQRSGGMIGVIGITDNSVIEEVAAQCGVEIANFNSPGQTVLSGDSDKIDAVAPVAKEAGAKLAKKLPVSGAFHSSLMQPAADEFATFLESLTFNTPIVPVLSNVTGEAHSDPESIKQLMAKQITSSVQWVKNTQWMVAEGAGTFYECGPGKVLTGLIKRIDKTVSLHNVSDLSNVTEATSA